MGLDACDCEDCLELLTVCNNDCEICAGCIEAKRDREEAEYEIDCAMGRR